MFKTLPASSFRDASRATMYIEVSVQPVAVTGPQNYNYNNNLNIITLSYFEMIFPEYFTPLFAHRRVVAFTEGKEASLTATVIAIK